MDAKYAADTKVADSKRMYEMQKAAFDMEVNARVSYVQWNFNGSNTFGTMKISWRQG